MADVEDRFHKDMEEIYWQAKPYGYHPTRYIQNSAQMERTNRGTTALEERTSGTAEWIGEACYSTQPSGFDGRSSRFTG